MSEINLEIKRLKYTDEFLFLIIKILILEEKSPREEINSKLNLEEFKYLLSMIQVDRIYKIINKQRLSILINKSTFIKENMPQYFNDNISRFAKITKENCIINISLLCKIYQILNKEKIDILFFKGCTLSLQTTGSIFNRGLSKDIDILVRKKDLIKTTEILLKNGFLIHNKSKVFLENNLYGFYSRNVVSQITLFKRLANHVLKIDLHWNITLIRDQLPNIKYIFNNKDFVKFNNIYIPTLNKENALIHTCIHNKVDGWKNIRGIIDFYRLFEINDENKIRKLIYKNTFIYNYAYCYKLLGYPKLKNYLDPRIKTKLQKKINHKFEKNDLLKSRFISKEDWSINKRINHFIRHLTLSRNPVEIIKILLNHLFPPKDFWCNSKQRFYYFHEIIIMRVKKMYIRIFIKNS